MKQFYLIVICFTLSSMKCLSQEILKFIDSAEQKFQRLKLPRSVSCDLKFERIETSGKEYFINANQTRVELKFFNVESIPYYDFYQSEFNTTLGYINWIKQNNSKLTEKEFQVIEENIDSSFIIVRISNGTEDLYQILSRMGRIFYCLQMSSSDLLPSRQIGYLKLYLKHNKTWHIEGNHF